MRASRGMGDINPSKMPKAKKVVRRDGPEPTKVFKKGGAVSRFADGGEPEKEPKKQSRLTSAAEAVGLAPVVIGTKAAEYGSKITKGRVSPEMQEILWGKSEDLGRSAGKFWKGRAKHAVGLSDSPDEGMKRGGKVKKTRK